MKKILPLLLLLTTLLQARTYDEIRFDGLLHLSRLSALELIGIEPGKEADIQAIDDSIVTLFKQGYFLDIWVTEEKGALVYHFTEKPVIAKIAVEGVTESDRDEKYLPALRLKKGDIFDEPKAEAARERLLEVTRMEGAFDTAVEYETETQENGGIELTYIINKGESVTITESVYDGARKFEAGDLEDDLANKEREFMGWFFGRNDGKLSLMDLEYDGQRLKDFYMKHGYLDAKVSDPLLTVDFSDYTADIYFKIEEGEPYTVEAVRAELADGEANLSTVPDELKLEAGEPFSSESLRKDITRVKEIVGSQGYAFARIFPDIQKDKENRKVTVVYRVSPGEKVKIRDVIISGNDRTLDRVIRREVFMAPGDTYDLMEIQESRKALGRLGYFENVELKEKRVGPNLMDLEVEVKEAPTGNLMVGGGYGSYDGFIVNASVSDRNIFGSGINFSFQVDKSAYTNRFNFSVTNPRVRDSDYSLGLNLYDTSYEAYNYYRETRGIGVTSGKRLDRHWSASLGLSYSQNYIEYDENVSQAYQYFNTGHTDRISLSPTLAFNNTDDYFVPRRGISAANYLELTGFGADEEYVKNTAKFAWFYGLRDAIDFDAIIRFRGRVGYMWGDEEDTLKTPLSSRFYLGGVRTIRGYKTSSISPVLTDGGEVVYDGGLPILLGGTQMYAQNLELSLPLIPSANMRIVGFYDYGMIGISNFDEKRSSYGFAMEWQSPMGPIQFVWGWALDAKEYDRTANFEFTIGQQF